jgi:hypothetical protein
MPGKILLGIAHALHMDELDPERAIFIEYLAQQAGIAGIVFDQKYRLDRFHQHRAWFCGGSRTIFSQKTLTLLTRRSNASNSTGLAR